MRAWMQHLLHSDGERVFVAEHGHGQRVANQDHVYTGFVQEARGGVVVGSQAGNRFHAGVFFRGVKQLVVFRMRFADRGKTHDVLQCPSALADGVCPHLLGIINWGEPPVDR